MKKYEVTLVEKLTYRIEVEAENDEQAEDLALASNKFTQNLIDDNDTVTESIKEIIE